MICLTLSGNTLSSCLDEIRQNREYIDLAELRLDLLEPEEQKKAAEEYGRIVDIRFPEVDPAWTAEQVKTEADRICREIDKYSVGAVMCQGEFTLTYSIVSRLKKKGITVLAACSRRRTEEILNDDGTIQKKVIFSFEGFREF